MSSHSVLRQWILVFGADCEIHCQVLTLNGHGRFLFCSGQEFRIFILIAGLSQKEQANFIKQQEIFHNYKFNLKIQLNSSSACS